MTNENKQRFTVITNEERIAKEEQRDKYRNAILRGYQTNPLKERLVKFNNDEGGHRFTLEDWLKW